MSGKVYMIPHELTPGEVVVIDAETCNGCNVCVDMCRMQVLQPNPVKGKPPLVVYPEECWFCACCEGCCPRGAIKMEHPLNQRVLWKRKETGEYCRVGMANPPPPYTKPPYPYP